MIGIPTYNNARTIAGTIDAARAGLAKYFPDRRAVVVASDAGSADETPALVAAARWQLPCVVARHEAPPLERVDVPFHGIPGRAAAQRTILEAAGRLGARACALIPPDCRSTAPEWIERLLRPVLEQDVDYVAPLYQRQRYDGTLTSGLIYPLTRALYGRQVRQPLGGHIALSARFVARLCGADATDAAFAAGLDLWMLAVLAQDRFVAAEAWLGPCVVEAPGRPTDLATIFAQAVGAVLAVVEATPDVWFQIRGSEPVPAAGAPLPLGLEPVELNLEGMVRAFRLGLKDLLPLWEQVLAPETLAELPPLEPGAEGRVAFPHDLWARVVYDFALAYRLRTLYRDHLLRSLVPLYLGRTAAFVRETVNGTARDIARWIEGGCRAFEQQKGYFIDRWP